ncbi:MAG TPA: amidohydrolase family protein [Caulobacteraceae bacterium]|nr:amidohydrolase family protein [Caulobacteraceae bacterium]
MAQADANTPDLVIRNGLIADGLGGELFAGDVAIRDGRIIEVGKVTAVGNDEFDAQGKLVTPGFIDVHTHYDGQAVWSQRLSPSSSHGVTTVIVGNCGVGFAPCRQEDHALLVSVMEGVEDIPEVVMTTGLDWSWETFPQFLDVLESRPHDIDLGAYLPHSPLRVYTMGERGARQEPASPDDLAKMEELAFEALKAGAMGFATSTTPAHRTGNGEQIPSYLSGEAEYQAMARAMRRAGGGVFQMVLDLRQDPNSEAYVPMLSRLSQTSGGVVSFSLTQLNSHPDSWRDALTAVTEANAQPDVEIRPQIYPRPIGMLLGFDLTLNPFSLCPSYQPLAKLSLAERVAALRDPDMRARLLSETPADPAFPLFVIARQFDRLFPLRTPGDYEPDPKNSIAALAAHSGRSPLETAYDLLLEDEGRAILLATLTNYAHNSLEDVREMMVHPDTVVALGDGGAHYGLVCDASFPTFVLTHWTRDRREGRISLPEAIKSLTSNPAGLVGLKDRGVIAAGYKADINVIDYDRLKLCMPRTVYDLPGGGRRLDQAAEGYLATFVSGSAIQVNGRQTGALPGRLVRGPQPSVT